jgi:hypothetical protein
MAFNDKVSNIELPWAKKYVFTEDNKTKNQALMAHGVINQAGL